MRKFAVVGSSIFNNYYIVYKVLSHFLPKYADIITGSCVGADALAVVYGEQNGHAVDIYEAKWDVYGKGAGRRRDMDMLQVAEQMIAFWDGKSTGTKDIIDLAKKKNIPCMIIDITEKDVISSHPDRVVNVYKSPYEVYIGRGRGSMYGNPFVISETCNRMCCVSMYLDWLMKNPKMIKNILSLKGKVLGCFCAPEVCHGDAICWLLDHVENELISMITPNQPKEHEEQFSVKTPRVSPEEIAQKYAVLGEAAPLYTPAETKLCDEYAAVVWEGGTPYIEIADRAIHKDKIRMTLKERTRVAEDEDVSRVFYKCNDKSNTTVFQQQALFADSSFKPGRWYVRASMVTKN